MNLRWDALLVRELARELDERLAGMRLRAIRFDGRERDAMLLFREATLVWRLHATRGWPAVSEAIEPPPDALPLPLRLRRVHAPEDERMIVLELLPVRSGRKAADLVVELLGNQWNCVVAEGEARTLRHVLHTRGGARALRVGQPYEPPAPSGRAGADGGLDAESWRELVDSLPPDGRRRALVSAVAWTSPLNAGPLLADPEHGHALWRRLATGTQAVRPALISLPRGPQPYPYLLPGVEGEPAASLLDAFEELAARADAEPPPASVPEETLLRRIEDEIDARRRRLTSLVAELEGVADPAALRASGDLILARFRDIPAGAASARLEGFDGRKVDVELEVGAPPQASAQAYYDRAGKAERARARLPELIAEGERRVAELASLADRFRAGDAEASEVEDALPQPASEPTRDSEEAGLPYRRYRSSGGLEIRVGRGARHNDDLTFHHSAPDDVWLHARHAAGAHVILRWQGPGNPPARDLADAAVLAALHSKARTSGSAPVDYTRRKYVRKPRKAPPGTVLPDRVATLFVEPDPEAVERLSWERLADG